MNRYHLKWNAGNTYGTSTHTQKHPNRQIVELGQPYMLVCLLTHTTSAYNTYLLIYGWTQQNLTTIDNKEGGKGIETVVTPNLILLSLILDEGATKHNTK